jgi:hypothetical protein
VTFTADPVGGAANVQPTPVRVQPNLGATGLGVPSPVSGRALTVSTPFSVNVADGPGGSRVTVAVRTEHADFLDEIAYHFALSDLLRIIGGEHDA